MSCICLYIIAVYLLFPPPPLISGRPRCYRRLHRCRVRLLRRRPCPYRRASRQAEPFSSPDIAYLSVLSCTRNCYCCCYNYNPIQLHSLILSPLDVPPLSYAAYYIYALFSSEPCALLVN